MFSEKDGCDASNISDGLKSSGASDVCRSESPGLKLLMCQASVRSVKPRCASGPVISKSEVVTFGPWMQYWQHLCQHPTTARVSDGDILRDAPGQCGGKTNTATFREKHSAVLAVI